MEKEGLEKQREEQQQRLDLLKARNRQLVEEQTNMLRRIEEKDRKIEEFNQDIVKTKEKKNEEETRGKNLRAETEMLREQKQHRT